MKRLYRSPADAARFIAVDLPILSDVATDRPGRTFSAGIQAVDEASERPLTDSEARDAEQAFRNCGTPWEFSVPNADDNGHKIYAPPA